MIDINIIDSNYEKIKQIVESTLMNYNYDYVINNSYKKSSNYKIYIIECNKRSDLNQIKKIRSNDWSSMIIITTNNNKLLEEILHQELLIISVINKNTDYITKLKNTIHKVLNNYENNPNTLKYSYKGVKYLIKYQDIIYIEKMKDSKNSIIKTFKNDYYIQKPLSEIITILDKRFIKISRSFIVNLEQVNSYDRKNNIMNLKNNYIITEISRKVKLQIINYFRGLE